MAMFDNVLDNPRKFLMATLVLFFLMHLYQISAPPNGYHQWRESDTAAVILNFYQEDANPMHPRVNQRGSGTGITGSELPIYAYTVVGSYYLFGPNHLSARLITVISGCLTLLFLYGIASRLTDRKTGLLATWACAFAPILFFYSYKIMPDISMLMYWLAAIYFYLRYDESGQNKFLYASALLLVVSACLKPLGLSILLPFAYLTWRSPKRGSYSFVKFASYAAITIAFVFFWFWNARQVNIEHGNAGFYLGEGLSGFLDFFLAERFFRKIFVQWPFELWSGWVLVPAFIIGWYLTFRTKQRNVLLLWGLSLLIIFALTAELSSTHDYYTLIAVPLCAIVTGLGLKYLYDRKDWRRYVVVAMVIFAPVGAFVGINFRFGDSSRFGEFDEIRLAADEQIEPESLVMVQATTTAIRLYQLNRRGWPLRFEIRSAKIKRCIDEGAKYLLLDNPVETYADSLSNFVKPEAFMVGPLYGYRVKEPALN